MQVSIAHFTFLIVGLLMGSLGGGLLLRGRVAVADANGRSVGEVERASLTERLSAAAREVASIKSRLLESEAHVKQLRTLLDQSKDEASRFADRANQLAELQAAHKESSASIENLKVKVAELTTTLNKERTLTQEKLTLIGEAREQLTSQFKELANDILDEKTKKFTEQNKSSLDHLLSPLKEKITTFQARVDDVYFNEAKDRSALAKQVEILTQLNNTLNQETQNLTLALKGDRKAQGNWGEIILDDVLERAGLLRGQHYERQRAVKSDDGLTHTIPDVVLRLPGDRNLVIDSKMTLPDYRVFAATESEEERTVALKRHLASIRTHIKGLSEKNYQALYGVASLDFVVMFIPLEPAFSLAVTNDCELFQHAWDKNILLVSPSTLLFVVRTVAYLWRQEDLSRNAKEISNRGAELYDKLVGFVGDLQKVGVRINQAQESFDDARRKFSEGSGNVIRQAEMLKKMGVKPTKALPLEWTEPSVEESLPLPVTESVNGHLNS